MHNKHAYKIGTSVVLRIGKEINDSMDPSFWIAKMLDIYKREEENFFWRLKVHQFDTIGDRRKGEVPLLKK